MKIEEKLMYIQSNLKVPKNQRNNFGNYNYRSCEDILETLKPLLLETKTVVVLTDEPIILGNRYYIKAIVELRDTESLDRIDAQAYAREDDTKKGMDLAQVTGSVSSYARKYALNGLFAIDDTKDADADTTPPKQEDKPKAPTHTPEQMILSASMKTYNLTKEEMTEILGNNGFTSSTEVKKKDIDNLVKEIIEYAKIKGECK